PALCGARSGRVGLPTCEPPCFVCGDDGADPVWATPDRAFAVPGLYTVVRCRRGGLLYQRPRVRANILPRATQTTTRATRSLRRGCCSRARRLVCGPCGTPSR